MADQFGFVEIIKQTKTDDGTLIVEGPATDTSLDRDYQICDPAWLDKAMPQWFREGGNIREQHDGTKAAGVALTYEKRAGDKHWISAEIVDPSTVKKIEKGVLRGFSFKAKNGQVVIDKAAAGGRIVGGDIFEVSVVDRPANPQCMFTIAKADSSGDLQPVEAPELVETEKADAEPTFTPTQFAELLKSLGKAPAETVEKRDFSQDQRDDAADKGQALPDGSFPIKTKADLKNAIAAYGRAKDPAKAKAHIIKRARALGAVDMLPDSWNISKADAVIAQVRDLVPGAVITKDDGGDPAFDPDTEASDVDNGTSAIAAIARLIISEAEGLAAGRMEELWDIQLLCQAADALQCFVGRETNQEAELMTDTDKADGTTDATTGTGTEPADTEKTDEGTDNGSLTKTDLSDLLADAITKATAPLKDELALVKAEMAKVLETPVAGGPARMRTTTQTAVMAKTDGLRREIDLCENAIPVTGGDVQKGYRERLATAKAELSKLDGAA